MQQYERAYRQAFLDAVRKSDPNWKIGKTIKSGVLDNITREDVEKALIKSGNSFIRNSIDYTI